MQEYSPCLSPPVVANMSVCSSSLTKRLVDFMLFSCECSPLEACNECQQPTSAAGMMPASTSIEHSACTLVWCIHKRCGCAYIQAQEQLDLIRQAEAAAKKLEEDRDQAQSEAAATVARAKREAAGIVQEAQSNAARIAREQGQALSRLDKELDDLLRTLNEQKTQAQQIEQVSDK